MAHKYKTEGERILLEAREQLAALFKHQEALSIAISKQQRRVAALSALVDEGEESDQILRLNLGGLTDVIRGVLRDGGPRGLSPKEIRNRLAQLYFPINEYTNFMASLHSVLSRLVTAGEVSIVEVAAIESGERHDETFYRWILKYGATNSLANTILKGNGRFKSRFQPKPKSRFNKK